MAQEFHMFNKNENTNFIYEKIYSYFEIFMHKKNNRSIEYIDDTPCILFKNIDGNKIPIYDIPIESYTELESLKHSDVLILDRNRVRGYYLKK